MLYHATISRPELESLEGLLGESLNIVTPVVWSAELRAPNLLIYVAPEEVVACDTSHPHGDVDRPSITTKDATFDNGKPENSVEQLGTVREINIISILVSFSPMVMGPEVEIAKGVTIPASMGYGFVYYQPSQFEAARTKLPEEDALIVLDIAIELVTDRYPSFVLYTRGFFVNASFEGLPDEDWVKLGVYARRPLQRLLTGGSGSTEPF
jgi:hypothetical protein